MTAINYKVEIRFPLYPHHALDVFNELLAHNVEQIHVDTRHHVTYETHISEELINLIRDNYQVKMLITPHYTELEEKVIEILKQCEDNYIELDYPVRVLREGSEGEYYDDVRNVSYSDEELEFGCTWSDVCKSKLTPDELTEIYQNIIDQTK